MKVLRVLTRPNVGGPMRQAVALWHEQRALGVRTLLVVGACEAGEAAFDLAGTGIPATESAAGDGGLLVVPTLRRGLHPARDGRAARALRAIVRAFRPDVVHTHTSKAGWLGRHAAWRERVPVTAHTFHGHVLRDYYPAPVSAPLRALERRLARRTDLLLAVSPTCAGELAAMGIGPARVLPAAVDVRAFAATGRGAARRRLGLAGDAVVLGFAGRLVRIKRPDLFAAAVARLPAALGLVFGEGPERAALGGSRLRLLGATEELPSLLPAADVLVMPSEREGCPLAAVEAFAAGVPVVGFDVPGVRDVLGAWGDGVLVPRREGASGLARAVSALLADSERRRRMTARAAQGLWRFAPAAVAAALCEAYRDRLGERQPPLAGRPPRVRPRPLGAVR